MIRVGRQIQSLSKRYYIRRGTGSTGYQVAVDTDGAAASYNGVLDVATTTIKAEYQQRYSTTDIQYVIRFIPPIDSLLFGTTSSKLRKDDLIIPMDDLERSTAQSNEEAADHLIRDIKNAQRYVYTVEFILDQFDQLIYLNDGADQPGM